MAAGRQRETKAQAATEDGINQKHKKLHFSPALTFSVLTFNFIHVNQFLFFLG